VAGDLAMNTATHEALLMRGVKAHQNQHYDDAQQCYETLLQSQPQHADAHYLLGMLFLEKNQKPEAIVRFETALQASPLHPEASLSLLELYLETQQPEKAQALSQTIFTAQPVYDIALQLAQLSEQYGHLEMGFNWYAEAFQLAPQEALALKLLENSLQHPQGEKWQQPIEAFCKTLNQGSELHAKLGNLALQKGYCQKALAYYAKAEEAFPHSDVLAYNQGVCYWEMNQAPDAILHFERAIQFNPQNPNPWIGLGQAYPQINDYPKALHAFEKAKSFKPQKDHLALTCRQWMTFPCIYNTREEQQERAQTYREQTKSLKELAPEISTDFNPFSEVGLTPFYSAYLGEDLLFQQKAWGDFFHQTPWAHRYDSICEKVKEKRQKASKADEKIKVAFLSKNFQTQHTIGQLNQGLIQHLDRNRFDIMVFHTDDVRTQQNPLWSQNPTEITWVPSSDLDKTAEIILNYEADCLFYPDIGMEAFSYCSAFRRLAPLQVTTWGHPVTTGSPAIDYLIGFDAAFHENSQLGFSEAIVSLPQSLIALPPFEANQKWDRSYFGFSAQDRLYVCSQSLFKIHPEMDAFLLGILENDPRGKLVLIAGSNPIWQETLLKRWSKQTTPSTLQRIVFQPRLTPAEFIAFQSIADVLLDSFPFAGGLTSLQALSLNVPLITVASSQLSGNITAAYYQEMALDHLICQNKEEALSQALAWGNDKDLNQEIRQVIAQQKISLFNQTTGIQAFENWLENTLRQS
jgi:protein O-GlcNAc transferase